MQCLSYIITAISIVATVANAYKKRWCFVVWLFTNAFWIIYDLYIGAYGQALLYVANFIICVMGLRNWKKENNPCSECRERKRADAYRNFLESQCSDTDKPKRNQFVEKIVIDKKTGKTEKYTYISVRNS